MFVVVCGVDGGSDIVVNSSKVLVVNNCTTVVIVVYNSSSSSSSSTSTSGSSGSSVDSHRKSSDLQKKIHRLTFCGDATNVGTHPNRLLHNFLVSEQDATPWVTDGHRVQQKEGDTARHCNETQHASALLQPCHVCKPRNDGHQEQRLPH